MILKNCYLLINAFIYFHRVASLEAKTEKTQKTKKQTIFDYIEQELYSYPIKKLSEYNSSDIQALSINYSDTTANDFFYNKDGFNIGNWSNIYSYYKYPERKPALSDEFYNVTGLETLIEQPEVHYNSCESNDEFCSYHKAVYLLNKINSTEPERIEALELLHRSEGTVPESLFLLATIYENYDIIFPSESLSEENTSKSIDHQIKSLMYFHKCAAKDDTNCQLALAHKYVMGENIEKDLSKAILLYYKVINKVIDEHNNNKRFPWILSNYERNIWNHDYFKFLHDEKLNDFEYIDSDKDYKSIVKDSSIILHTKNNLPMSTGLGDSEFINIIHFLHKSRKLNSNNTNISDKIINSINLYSSTFEDLKYLYLTEDYLYIDDDNLLYIYTDIINTLKGNIYTNQKDLNYVFDMLKGLITTYNKQTKYINSKISLLGKYYLRELIIIFTNIYKEYGDYEWNSPFHKNLIFSLYKLANELTNVRDETYWEVFRFLHYVEPQLPFDRIFKQYMKDCPHSGYTYNSALNYANKLEVESAFQTKPNPDFFISNDFSLQKSLQVSMMKEFVPAIFYSCQIDFMIIPEIENQDQANLIYKLKMIIENVQMKENIGIFQQNFVNIMNYKQGIDQEFNMFPLIQLATMGFEKSINNLATELLNPVKLLTSADSNRSADDAVVKAGISKYLASYKLGSLNHALQLSSIFESLSQWGRVLSLNYLISDTNGNFYSFYNLARMYEEGNGVEQDYEMAEKYYNKVLNYDALSFYTDPTSIANGLEISVKLLLLKLRVKKFLKKFNFIYKVLPKMNFNPLHLLSRLNNIQQVSSAFIGEGFEIIKDLTYAQLDKVGIDPSVLLSVFMISLFAFIPKILKYLTRVNRWTININGVQYVDGVEVAAANRENHAEQEEQMVNVEEEAQHDTLEGVPLENRDDTVHEEEEEGNPLLDLESNEAESNDSEEENDDIEFFGE